MECPECSGELFGVQRVTQFFSVEGVGVDGNVDLGDLVDESWDTELEPIQIKCEDCETVWSPRDLALEVLEERDDRYY